jgi:heme-degrading monooxygenase HmoA
MQSEFERFFVETAVPLLESQPGMLGLQTGKPHSSSPTEFLMTTTWRDLDALRGFTGDQWEEAVIAPEEEHLLKSVSVHHYEGLGTGI